VPQDLGCNFLHKHTEATATCSIYINRFLVVNCTEATATFISYRLRAPTDPSAPFKSSTNRLPPRPRMVARDSCNIQLVRNLDTKFGYLMYVCFDVYEWYRELGAYL
jgi:hypothetical protein